MTTTDLEKLLSRQSLAQLRADISAGKSPNSPAQAQQIAAHAKSLTPSPRPLRLAIVHTYTSELLDPWLDLAGALQGLAVHTYHAPYGLALQEAAAGSALLRHAPDLTLLMLRREDLHPGFLRPVAGLRAEAQDTLRAQALGRLREIVLHFRAQPVGHLVLTILPALAKPALGFYDAHAESSEAQVWAACKAELGQWLRQSVPSALFLDLDEVLLQVGRSSFFDRRFWYSSRFPFSAEAAGDVARRIVAIGTVLGRPRAKVLVLDADNTLWGGIIGEDGMAGIALGPDYPGSLFVDFQRRILDLQQRGFILALCSKNNAADVDQVLQNHPHQLLRDGHFAARRVNWIAKPENLKSLAAELNLGLDSFIFVDDSDHECAAVRHALPQVEVVQVPSRVIDMPTCLDQVARLEVLALTSEDGAKTALYAQERQRRDLNNDIERSGGGAGDYLLRLDMRMHIELAALAHVPRLSQLTNKTNQFNLTTRRYDEQRVRAMVLDPGWIVADFSLADVFGDSGLVGLALLQRSTPRNARLDTFLMSCRVIGRDAEAAFLQALLRHLAGLGIEGVQAEFLPTAKNELARLFLPSQGFVADAQGIYWRDLRALAPRAADEFPIKIMFDACAAL